MIGFLTPELAKEFLKEFAKETVISIFRWLKGKKPDEVKRTGNGQVELKASGETKIVNINVFNLYGDSVIRDGLDKVTKPLREAAIERIKVKKDSTEQTVFDKEEADIFKAEPLALQTQSAEPLEGERDAVLVVSKLSFKEGVSWTFFERGAIVVAKIEDEQFWERVHSHEVTFGEGDLLKVRLFWEIQRRHHEIKQKNTILKVLDKLERPEQLQFDVESEKPKRRTHKRKVN